MPSIELKPCPFCGQQPEVEEWRRGAVIAHRNCPVGVDSFSDDPNGDGFGVYFSDLESAARAWNTRAERTCKPANVAEYAWDDFECSECRWVTWSFLMEHEGCGIVCKPRFCPNCGAKVVE